MAPPDQELQVHAIVHPGADLGGADGLFPQQKQRPGVAAGQVKRSVLQVERLVGQQFKGAFGRGGRLGPRQLRPGRGGPPQGVAAVAHKKLVVGLCLAAQQRQRLGGAVHQDGVAEFPVHGKPLDQFPAGGELAAAVKAQAVVGAALGDHPDRIVPAENHREGQVERLFQRHLPGSGRAVGGQFADLDAPLAGSAVHGLGKEPAAAVLVEEQRVGVPEALPPRQLPVRFRPQGGQRVGPRPLRAAAHGHRIDLFFAHHFAQQPPGRHMQGAV